MILNPPPICVNSANPVPVAELRPRGAGLGFTQLTTASWERVGTVSFPAVPTDRKERSLLLMRTAASRGWVGRDPFPSASS